MNFASPTRTSRINDCQHKSSLTLIISQTDPRLLLALAFQLQDNHQTKMKLLTHIAAELEPEQHERILQLSASLRASSASSSLRTSSLAYSSSLAARRSKRLQQSSDSSNVAGTCALLSSLTKTIDAPPFTAAPTDQKKSEAAARRARIIFLLSLSGAAVTIGVATFLVLRHAERQLAQREFEAIAKRAVYNAQATTLRNHLGSITLANIVANTNPNVSNWPFAYVHGFESMATSVIETTDGQNMAFVPILYDVTREKIEAYNEFAYDYYENKRHPPFPPGTGVQAAEGKGIWALDRATGSRYVVTDASNAWGGTSNVSAPMFHYDEGANYLLLYDFYKMPEYGQSIDSLLECAATRQTLGDENMECGVVTEMWDTDVEHGGSASLLFQPIYPSFDPLHLGGFIATSIAWNATLVNVFDETVQGVDCVVETAKKQTTYRIRDGIAEFVGYDDFHESDFDSNGIEIILTGKDLFSDCSPSYKLTLYPSDEFNKTYGTHNPMISAFCTVLAIVLTSGCFWAYDCSVNRDDLVLKKQMFLAGWNHRKRFEEEGRGVRDGGPDDEESQAVAGETTVHPVASSRENSRDPMNASLPASQYFSDPVP